MQLSVHVCVGVWVCWCEWDAWLECHVLWKVPDLHTHFQNKQHVTHAHVVSHFCIEFTLPYTFTANQYPLIEGV